MGVDGDDKQLIADSLLDNVPIISTQVISEYLNILKIISKMSKSDLLKIMVYSMTVLSVSTNLWRYLWRISENAMGKYQMRLCRKSTRGL